MVNRLPAALCQEVECGGDVYVRPYLVPILSPETMSSTRRFC